MANPVDSYFSALKKKMDSGALFFHFKDRAPIAIHKTFLFKKYDGGNGNSRSLFSTFISALKYDHPPLGIYLKNNDGVWVDIMKLGIDYPAQDPIANAELSGFASRYEIDPKIIGAVEYTDSEGFVFTINERDGEEFKSLSPIEIDENHSATIVPYSLDDPTISFNERELLRDLAITMKSDNMNDNNLVWLNGRFVSPKKDNTNSKRFYIRGGMDYVDSWSIDQPNVAPKVIKRGENTTSCFEVVRNDKFLSYGAGVPGEIICASKKYDLYATVYVENNPTINDIAPVIRFFRISDGSFISSFDPLTLTTVAKVIGDIKILPCGLFWGDSDYVYFVVDYVIYRLALADLTSQPIVFAGNNTATPTDNAFLEDNQDAKDINLLKSPNGIGVDNRGQRVTVGGIRHDMIFFAKNKRLYIAFKGIIGYIDEQSKFHRISGTFKTYHPDEYIRSFVKSEDALNEILYRHNTDNTTNEYDAAGGYNINDRQLRQIYVDDDGNVYMYYTKYSGLIVGTRYFDRHIIKITPTNKMLKILSTSIDATKRNWDLPNGQYMNLFIEKDKNGAVWGEQPGLPDFSIISITHDYMMVLSSPKVGACAIMKWYFDGYVETYCNPLTVYHNNDGITVASTFKVGDSLKTAGVLCDSNGSIYRQNMFNGHSAVFVSMRNQKFSESVENLTTYGGWYQPFGGYNEIKATGFLDYAIDGDVFIHRFKYTSVNNVIIAKPVEKRFLSYTESFSVSEDSKYDTMRFKRNLRMFKWRNVKISNWNEPAILRDYDVLLSADDDVVSVYKEMTFSESINKNAHVIINNGRILKEDEYYIDPLNPKKIILNNIHHEAQDYYRSALDYYTYYDPNGKKDPRFMDPIDYVLAKGPKYPALEATRKKYGYQSYHLVNFESIDGKLLRIVRHRNARTNFPYYDEIGFDELDINDLVLINGYFIPYEWVHDRTIRIPKTKSVPLYRQISTLDNADVYRLVFVTE